MFKRKSTGRRIAPRRNPANKAAPSKGRDGTMKKSQGGTSDNILDSIALGHTFLVCQFDEKVSMGDGRYFLIPLEVAGVWDELRKANRQLADFQLLAWPVLDTWHRELLLVLVPQNRVIMADEDRAQRIVWCEAKMRRYAAAMSNLLKQDELAAGAESWVVSAKPIEYVKKTDGKGSGVELDPNSEEVTDDDTPDVGEGSMRDGKDESGKLTKKPHGPRWESAVFEGEVTAWSPADGKFSLRGSVLARSAIFYDPDQADDLYMAAKIGCGTVSVRVTEQVTTRGREFRLESVWASHQQSDLNLCCPFCGLKT